MLDTMRKYLWVLKAISKLNLSTQKEIISRFLTAQKKYIPHEKTKAAVDDILKCALCPNMCRFDCPVLQAAKSETFSPAGKARIAYLLEMERFISDDAVNLMYACAGCSACQKWCPFDFSGEDLLLGVRKDIAEKGWVPPSLMNLTKMLVENHTIFEGGKTSLRVKVTQNKADVLYFAGCTTLNNARRVGKAFLEIMEKAGVDVAVLPEEWCCGAPLSILGLDKDFKEFAARNTQAISEGDYKTLVCGCPDCTYMFRDVYSEMGTPLQADVFHTSEFLLQLVKEGKISLQESTEEYVYHDPCILARKLHIYEEPRELLNSVPGLTLKEAHFNKEGTKCCGVGGMLRITSPEISFLITRERGSELRGISHSIVTACPACETAFRWMNDCEILDISELILKYVT